MTTIINANTSAGLTQTADTSGIVKLQSNGVTTNALAWVNFNGTGTVAIRSSYNVSSITDNGTGDYTVNFATALSDANYSSVTNARADTDTSNYNVSTFQQLTSTKTASAYRFRVLQLLNGTSTSYIDSSDVNVVVFGN